jgi:protein gp37
MQMAPALSLSLPRVSRWGLGAAVSELKEAAVGANTLIPWCHATFNPWWGCVEVSPACDHCYARELAKRFGHAVWGKDTPRRFFGDGYWEEPVGWNRRAEKAGERYRVFCASMADIGEERPGVVGRQMGAARRRLWSLIVKTPFLDWLLLTKRPRFYRRVPAEILAMRNVWPGTTVESADYLWRAEELLKVPCAGPRWVSYEPVLGPVDFAPLLCRTGMRAHGSSIDGEAWVEPGTRGLAHDGCRERLEWIIAGCENRSGHRPGRPMDETWIRSVRDQCRAASVAFYLKQAVAEGRVVQTPELDGRRWVEFPR